MGKIADHPVVVGISVLAGIAAILTFSQQFWDAKPTPAGASQPSPTVTPSTPVGYRPEWWIVATIGKHPTISGYFIDRSSIQIDGSMRKAWAVLQNAQPESDGQTAMKNHGEYDCKNMSYRELKSIKHYNDGSNQTESSEGAQATAIVPDSIGMDIFNFICFGPSGSARKINRANPAESIKAINQPN